MLLLRTWFRCTQLLVSFAPGGALMRSRFAASAALARFASCAASSVARSAAAAATSAAGVPNRASDARRQSPAVTSVALEAELSDAPMRAASAPGMISDGSAFTTPSESRKRCFAMLRVMSAHSGGRDVRRKVASVVSGNCACASPGACTSSWKQSRHTRQTCSVKKYSPAAGQ